MASREQRSAAFWYEYDKLRRAARRPPSTIDIAKVANKAGVSFEEALDAMQRPGHWPRTNRSLYELVGALGQLLKVGRVLETGEMGAVLSNRLVEAPSHASITYITRNTEIAEGVKVLLGSDRFRVVQHPDALGAEERFDLIVAQPPIGYGSPNDPAADGFGGEVVRRLLPLLSENGWLVWVTARGVLWNTKGKETLASIAASGWGASGTIDLPRGVWPGSSIEGIALVLRPKGQERKLLGSLRDSEAAGLIAAALVKGPSKNVPPTCVWIDASDSRTFADIERDRLIQRLIPRGRYAMTSLASLLFGQRIERADRPIPENDQGASFLYVPEYAGSQVTTDLTEQTVRPKAVYRIPIDATKVNPAFLVRLLNSKYGKYLRNSVAHGATIQRVAMQALFELQLPLPDLQTQNRIVRVYSDVGVLKAALAECLEGTERDWQALGEASETVDQLKAVLDIERRIADWWRELPYPLATIYRRYHVSREPKERLETLLHFFEVTAIYLAVVGLSHIRALRSDGSEVLDKLLHPDRVAGIERTDFGFWINLTLAAFKELRRTSSDSGLRPAALDYAGPALLSVAEVVIPLGEAAHVLSRPRNYRNSWTAHGGHIKKSDALRIDQELQTSIHDLYTTTAAIFRRFRLVRPGKLEAGEGAFLYDVERLIGSDPTFETDVVELNHTVKSNTLAFWLEGARAMCTAVPFFRLGAPQDPEEKTVYVYNRVEGKSFRWVSYQEARDQEIIVPDEELGALVRRHSA
jgi:hypothetical protein